VPGAGVLVSLSDAAPIERARRTEEEKHHPRPRHLNMNGLGAYLTDAKLAPPISVLFVQGANPVVMNPNQRAVLEGLARDDLFTIVHDQVLTDTARWADVVLPATTNFEYDDIAASYGSFTLQPVEKVIDPVGESVSNNALAAMLAERLGFGGPRFPAEASSLVGESVRDGVDASRPVVLHEPGTLVQFRDAFPIGGKAHLAGLFDLGVPRYVELDDAFPLALITPANPKTINSIFGEFNRPDPTVRVSPADAVARQLSDGQLVRVHNRAASVMATLRIDADIRAGVVAMTKGVWLRDTHEGVGVNALVPDTFSDVGDGACFNDARVEVSPA
jgi:anaerobic selenocysteine-containing dehydrogenase